jgi:hypothetical protein
MDSLSQDPLAECLVKFCKKPYNPLNYLDFHDILAVNVLAQDFRKYSIMALQTQKPIQNPVMRGLADRFKWLLEKNAADRSLIILFCFISDVVTYLNHDDEFGRAAILYNKEFMRSFLSLECLRSFIVNRNYTDLLLQTIHIDLEIKTDGDLHAAAINNFLDDFVLLAYDLRKTYYEMFSQRIQCYKEELIASVMHPSRIQKLLDSGLDLDQIMEIY